MTAMRNARLADVAALRDIERSSGEAFRLVPGLEWIADDEPMDVAAYRNLIGNGTVLMAEYADRPVGFVAGAADRDAFHIAQISVARDAQGKGIGTLLMREAERVASASGAAVVTLTTFRDLAFNETFYEALGFRRIGEAELDARLRAILDREATCGLPRERRCAMRKNIGDIQNS